MAKGKREKAPAGQWGMPDEGLSSALGHFIMSWSLIDATIEVSIAKQLGLTASDGSIVTAGLLFRSRASILLSLLNRDPKGTASAIRIVKDMLNISDRNDMLHSIIGGSKNLIWFNRRKTEDKFTSKIERYDRERLLHTALRCSSLASQLMEALGISKEDYLAFFQESHNAVNSD